MVNPMSKLANTALEKALTQPYTNDFVQKKSIPGVLCGSAGRNQDLFVNFLTSFAAKVYEKFTAEDLFKKDGQVETDLTLAFLVGNAYQNGHGIQILPLLAKTDNDTLGSCSQEERDSVLRYMHQRWFDSGKVNAVFAADVAYALLFTRPSLRQYYHSDFFPNTSAEQLSDRAKAAIDSFLKS